MANDSKVIKKDLTSDEMLAVIFTYAGKIANEKQLDQLLMLMADMGRELIIADRCSLWLIDQTNQELWTKVAHGVKEIRIPIDTGVVGHAIGSGEPIIIDDAYESEYHNADVDKRTGYRTKAILVIPIRNNEGEILGAYQAINKMTEKDTFSESDRQNLEMAASYTGKSIESALLYHEIEQTQREIIFTMGEIGESRSKETGNHVKRVAEYSWLLAVKYGIDEQEAEILKMASPMHDIGKVAVPDAILNKPGKLTHEEYDVIKSHAQTGHDLLKNSKRTILQAAAIIAHEHHEKWNGRGYPRGAAGEDIHIYGRITAIADVFDALGSDRSYKKAWDIPRILKLFEEERGQHFDPNLIDLFLLHIDELLEIKQKYDDIFN